MFLNTDHFADVCKRYKGGSDTDVRTFSAVVTLPPADETDAYGRGQIQRATLVCASTEQLTQRDAVGHAGLRYEVESVSAPEHGMITVQLKLYEGDLRGAKQLKNGDI